MEEQYHDIHEHEEQSQNKCRTCTYFVGTDCVEEQALKEMFKENDKRVAADFGCIHWE